MDAALTTAVSPSRRAVAAWLLVVCALIFAMVVLGGVTRLTGSGLSMVDWEPIMGVVPPLDHRQWEEAFRAYQRFPEYREINRDMTLAEFKEIYWVEYAHRMLGRGIGLAFLLPFLFFWFTGRIERALVPKLVVMFALGALQGLLGWYMVQSGLVDEPHVSPYRLAAHLLAAFVIYGYIFWVALGLLYPRPENRRAARLRRAGRVLTAFVVLVVLSGAFVAGTKAGFAFNTFPLMNGRLVPEGLYALNPWWRNLFENLATVQFNHRWLAIALALTVLIYWVRARAVTLTRRARVALHLLLGAAAVQVGLGIGTLLLIVPVPLAAAHQAGALVLFTAALFANHQLRG